MHLLPVGSVLSVSIGLAASIGIVTICAQAQVVPPVAHFHHIHINATDPAASIAFYTPRFDCEKAVGNDAIRAQDSWILFNRVGAQPPSEILSAIWHIGWGAEDMPAAYREQLDATRCRYPIRDSADRYRRPRGNGQGQVLLRLRRRPKPRVHRKNHRDTYS